MSIKKMHKISKIVAHKLGLSRFAFKRHKKGDIRMKALTRAELGRTMVEMLAVIAIIGVLSIASISLYRYSMNTIMANSIVTGVRERSIIVGQQRVTQQPLNLKEFFPDSDKDLIYKKFEVIAYNDYLNDEHKNEPIAQSVINNCVIDEDDVQVMEVYDIPYDVCEKLKNLEFVDPTCNAINGSVYMTRKGHVNAEVECIPDDPEAPRPEGQISHMLDGEYKNVATFVFDDGLKGPDGCPCQHDDECDVDYGNGCDTHCCDIELHVCVRPDQNRSRCTGPAPCDEPCCRMVDGERQIQVGAECDAARCLYCNNDGSCTMPGVCPSSSSSSSTSSSSTSSSSTSSSSTSSSSTSSSSTSSSSTSSSSTSSSSTSSSSTSSSSTSSSSTSSSSTSSSSSIGPDGPTCVPPEGSGLLCCGSQLYDPNQFEACCGGTVYAIGSNQKCCFGELYDSTQKECCGTTSGTTCATVVVGGTNWCDVNASGTGYCRGACWVGSNGQKNPLAQNNGWWLENCDECTSDADCKSAAQKNGIQLDNTKCTTKCVGLVGERHCSAGYTQDYATDDKHCCFACGVEIPNTKRGPHIVGAVKIHKEPQNCDLKGIAGQPTCGTLLCNEEGEPVYSPFQDIHDLVTKDQCTGRTDPECRLNPEWTYVETKNDLQCGRCNLREGCSEDEDFKRCTKIGEYVDDTTCCKPMPDPVHPVWERTDLISDGQKCCFPEDYCKDCDDANMPGVGE